MIVGGAGIMLANIPLMLAAVFAMGVHSTFFGPIKYAILPQHLRKDEVLGGTGLVEAGHLYRDPRRDDPRRRARGDAADRRGGDRSASRRSAFSPGARFRRRRRRPSASRSTGTSSAPRSSWSARRCTSAGCSWRSCSISFFWTIGAVLIIIFPPLVKNVLGANEQVASLFIAIFSIGIAIGSVLINRLLKSEVSARFAPASVIAMGVFVLLLHFVALAWGKHGPELTTLGNFIFHPMAGLMIVALLGVAITGGMFVVPLYAFLTTTVPKTETARTVAANNIVNSGAMVIGSLLAFALSSLGRRPGRPAAAGRGDVHRFGVARLEAPPRLRLGEEHRDEDEAGEEGRSRTA